MQDFIAAAFAAGSLDSQNASSLARHWNASFEIATVSKANTNAQGWKRMRADLQTELRAGVQTDVPAVAR